MSREYFKRQREEQRAYSRAVNVKGGTIVYLAGISALTDAQGNSLARNFTAQHHRVFVRLRETMELVDGTLDDIVTLTVFITAPRYSDGFAEAASSISRAASPQHAHWPALADTAQDAGGDTHRMAAPISSPGAPARLPLAI